VPIIFLVCNSPIRRSRNCLHQRAHIIDTTAIKVKTKWVPGYGQQTWLNCF